MPVVDLLQGCHAVDCFNTDYASARAGLANRLAQLNRYPLAHQAWPLPNDSTLVTDSYWIGARDASTVLVLISGTHGVEGYCGSAMQQFISAALQQQQLSLQPQQAILLIHALNPWGMQWARRCDQDGIDLNRNFIDFKQRPAPHPDYPVVVERMLATDNSDRWQAMRSLIAAWGQTHFDTVFSGGQYHLPWAPFYGGEKPSTASQTIDAIIAHWQLQDRELVVLDLHTGLGPWGFGELISDHPLHSPGDRCARSLFGAAIAATDAGESFSVPKAGLLDYRWHQLMDQQGCFLTLEVGSYGTDALFTALLEDHLFWKTFTPADAGNPDYQNNRARILEHFCPNDSLWQQAALFKAWQACNRVLERTAL